MDTMTKVKEWLSENAPILSRLYENKYVGMVYDRFASLPPKQQRQVMMGGVLGVVAIIVIFILSSYMSLWSYSSRAEKYYSMVNMLQQYQKHWRDKSQEIQHLERNSQLGPPGAFKQYLLDQGRNASISPRMLQVEEKEDPGMREEDAKGGHEVGVKQATVKIQRVNLNQVKGFLQDLEFGPYNLSISSVKITNDDKIRGYMNVELGVIAYLFQAEEGGG